MSEISKIEERHPFGGCDRLLNNYQTIGLELLRYEGATYPHGQSSGSAMLTFREGVSFVGVEVLESYLEDLLDSRRHDDTLFIHRDGVAPRRVYSYIALLGLVFAIGAGIYSHSIGASFLLSFCLSISVALPFAILWNFLPRAGLARRMALAQVVSQEIARRRGIDKEGSDKDTRSFGLGRLLSPTTPQSAHGAACVIFDFRPPPSAYH